ncbi:MAG: phytanoyl-CoA dioxygenase family protein [Gammaproteobacteria bacterium]|nr:phytanoyl-CoA dioxygenase family protein [Gammaproteobacteria bacterium]
MSTTATAAKRQAPSAARAEWEAQMNAYREEGKQRALALGNRGPLILDRDGRLHPDIEAAYWAHGFYVFEGVIDPAELAELRGAVDGMIARAPVAPGASLDAEGRPALGRDYARDPYEFCRSLSDPHGGTDHNQGRHPTKMSEPEPDAGAPEFALIRLRGMCMAMPAALRLYGHPKLLAVAQTLNGPDFTPFNDVIFVKPAGIGASISWHQDGVTHWDNPDWNEGIHGFNFQTQLYPSTVANCLWVVPGTHKLGKIDIKRMVAEAGGSDRLLGAVPMYCEAGDVTLTNRQTLHGSFANTSPDPRISITFGFHRRSSVLGQLPRLSMRADTPIDEQQIFDRAAVIQLAIDARRQHFPDETPFRYQPFAGLEDEFRYDESNIQRVLRDYNTKDLSI